MSCNKVGLFLTVNNTTIAKNDMTIMVIKGINNCSATFLSNIKIITNNLIYIIIVAIISADETLRPAVASSPLARRPITNVAAVLE